MTRLRRFLPLAALVLLSLPLCADSLQKKIEGEVLLAEGTDRKDAVLDEAIREGLSFPPVKDLASYLAEFHEAYLRLPLARVQYVEGMERGGKKVETLRGQFLGRVRLPLSAAHMSLARHYLQSRKTGLGYGLDLSGTFHRDLDQAIVYKNASALHAFFFQHLANADLVAEAKDPTVSYRGLLAGVARGVGGYTVQDFKDIFYFQAPEASAGYIDEEIFSLYTTLKEQKAAIDPILRLVDEVAGPGKPPLPERHLRLKRILGALAFGAGPAGKDAGTTAPPYMAELNTAVTGWALRQGLMRSMLFGEHLAYEYALCLQKPEGIERLQALQRRLQRK